MAAEQGETAAFGPSTERLRARATELVAAVPAWVWLTVLMGGSWAIRAVLAVRDPSPWIFQDELLYSELAKSFAATGHFAVREVPVPGAGGFGVVYPVLIAPAWKLFQNVPTAYEAAKIINSLVMSLGAIPVYLLARRMVSKAWALAAAVLALTLPGMVYTSVIMTENAFYPVFLFWVLAVVQALERPTVLRQLAAVALTFVAYLTRSQGAVLVPALVTAIVLLVVLDALSDERGFWRAALARTRAFWATWLTLVIGAGGFLLLEVGIRGKTFSTAVLGGYTILTTSSYSANDVARWFLYHSAELDLAVGVLPFAAFFLLVIAAFRRMPPSREARVFAVVALSASVWLLAEVAAFASSPFGLQILERNDFYLEPLFLIALVVWAAGVLPRSWLSTGVAAVAAVVLVGRAPYGSFIGPRAVSNAFALLPLWRIEEHGWVTPGRLTDSVVVAGIAAGLIFVFVPRRLALIAPLLVFLYLAWATSPVEGKTSEASRDSRFGGIQGPLNWIDRAVGGTQPKVAAIWSGAPGLNYVALWNNEFFNRTVGPVYNLSAPPDGLPEETLTLDPGTAFIRHGTGKVLRAEYVLSDGSMQVAGKTVATDPGISMAVYRVDGPVRVVRQTQGIYPDKWSGPGVQYTRYPCAAGTLSVALAGYRPLQPRAVTVVARNARRLLGRIVVPPGGRRVLTLPLEPRRGYCLVNFSISPTAIPAKVLGNKDPRVLGLLFKRLDYRPR